MPASATLSLTDALTRFQTNLALYARKCLVIHTKDARRVHLELNSAQRIAQERVTAQRERTHRVRIVILKARQEGISTWVAARFFRSVHLWPNIRAFVIADVSKRSGSLFDIYDRFHSGLPPDVRPQTRYTAKRTELVYDRSRPDLPPGLGSSIVVDTAKDVNAGRAGTIHRLHASELAYWENAEATWISLMAAVPMDGSEVIVESTANGVGNVFHALWEEAEAGNSEFEALFLPWWIHDEYVSRVTRKQREEILASNDPYERGALDTGIEWEHKAYKLTPEQLSWRRRMIATVFRGDERMYRQEYPSTAEEAFLVSGNPFFDENSLLRYLKSSKAPIARGNLLDAGGIVFSRAERGYLRIWEFPRPEGLYVIFADTAEGRQVAARGSRGDSEHGGTDFDSADVFDCERRRFVAQLHGRMAPEVFADMCWRLGHFYSSAGMEEERTVREPSLIGIERNHGSGQTVLRLLRDEYHYPHLFRHRLVNRRAETQTEVLGWMTNTETRQVMLDELAGALREDSIDYPNPEGLKEMRTFVRGEDGKPAAQEGCHDDRVISAAGALQMARYASAAPKAAAPPPEVPDTPTGL